MRTLGSSLEITMKLLCNDTANEDGELKPDERYYWRMTVVYLKKMNFKCSH